MSESVNDEERPVQIPAGRVSLQGDLYIPRGAPGAVLFAHGSGSSRHSTRNRYVARVLQDAGLGTLLFDLLTSEEELIDEQIRHLRFDIGLLASRLAGATDWFVQNFGRDLTIGYFGASTGAAAALVASVVKQDVVKAVVSRGGRPDLAGKYLERVRAPTLLIVGGDDEPVVGLNYAALKLLQADKEVAIIPGATHLFEEPGKLEQVAKMAGEWFARHLVRSRISDAQA